MPKPQKSKDIELSSGPNGGTYRISQEDFRKIKEQLEGSTGQKLNEAQIQDLITEIYRNGPFFDTNKRQVAVNMNGQVYTSTEELCPNAQMCTGEGCNGRCRQGQEDDDEDDEDEFEDEEEYYNDGDEM